MYTQSPLGTILGEKKKHKTFISFHHADEAYREEFETEFGEHFICKSVQDGDIDPDNQDEYAKRLIQDDCICDSSVVIALYGAETRKRKHVDWEISAGLSAKVGGHSGLVVVILPTFPVRPFDTLGNYKQELLYPYLHPRTAANIKSGFAQVYFWKCDYSLPVVDVQDVLRDAHERRITHKDLIDNSHPQYINNLP